MSRWKPQRKRTLLSTHQAAELLEIHPSSLIKWINDGLLSAHRTPGGHRRIRVADLLRFLQEHDMAIPEELIGERRRVLWVDTDKVLIRAVKRALKRGSPGIDVQFCESGIDALVKVGAERPQVVVLDIGVPDVDGIEFCQRLKAQSATRGIFVILVSEDADDEAHAEACGADRFLQKPLDVRALLEMCEGLPQAA